VSDDKAAIREGGGYIFYIYIKCLKSLRKKIWGLKLVKRLYTKQFPDKDNLKVGSRSGKKVVQIRESNQNRNSKKCMGSSLILV
jgi:hypothetical protein